MRPRTIPNTNTNEIGTVPRARPRVISPVRDFAPELAAPRELWVGAHLPYIALEALGADAQGQCLAVVESEGSSQHVVSASGSARSAGVQMGMTLAAALALVPQLQVKSRDIAREQELLEKLARCAQQFTPRVSLEPPDGLLLEVQGSLRLFGGAAKLHRAFMAECVAAGARPILALAPTPLAALAGARAGRSFHVLNATQLAGQVARLPLGVLRWPEETLERLAKMGVRTVGQALRLPRAGFAKRFGKQPLAELDRLVGRSADLRSHFHYRERFRMRHSFLYELEQHDAVLRGLEPLLLNLEEFLQTRQCGITQLECRLRHRHAPPTRCILRLAAPEADAQRFTALLGERLATITLPEPVRTCELRSGALVPRPLCSNSLWQPGEHGGRMGGESSALIERLRARLGADAVYGLQLSPGHRPELAWSIAEPGASTETRTRGSATSTPSPVRSAATRAASAHSASSAATAAEPQLPWPAFRRPLWLMPEPQPLTELDGLPRRHGPLRLIGEPERIETGWWDGRDMARDYYVAVDVCGVRLWVFRERGGEHRWFLHGVFG